MNEMRSTDRTMARGLTVLALHFLFLLGIGATAYGFDDPHDASAQAESHYQLAVRFYGEGRYREAVYEFERAIGVMPEAIFYCNRAVALIKLDEMEAALRSMVECRDRFEGDDEELHQIDAQTRALEIVARSVRLQAVVVARDMSMGMAMPVQPVVVVEPSRGTASRYGYLGLGLGAGLLASALVLDWASADLRQDYVTQSRGGPGTSEAQHALLADRLRSRQQAFYGLVGGAAAVSVVGAGLLTYHFASSKSGSERVGHLRIGTSSGAFDAGLRVSF